MPGPLPRQPAPALDLPLVGGDRFDLAAATPIQFTLVVAYRGVHCPQCHTQLWELDGRLGELRDVGVDEVVAVSGDDRERAERAVREWELNYLRVAYGMDEATMRAWGLYVSKGLTDSEPALFGEPGLFLVRPDASLFSAHVQSTPFARPRPGRPAQGPGRRDPRAGAALSRPARTGRDGKGGRRRGDARDRAGRPGPQIGRPNAFPMSGAVHPARTHRECATAVCSRVRE